MRLTLDLTSGVPIYRQIRDAVVEGVAAGDLQPGEQLPTVRQLAGDLGINPMTVQKAYTLLKNEGLLVLDRRRGAHLTEMPGKRPDAAFQKKARLLLSEARAQGVAREALERLLQAEIEELYGKEETK